MSYALVNICQFLSKFSKFWIQNAHTSDPEAIGGTQRVLNKVQSTVRWRPKPPKIIKVNKVYSLICCTAWVLILYFSLLMTSKKIWALCYLDNVTKYIHSSSSSKCISTCLVLFWWQDFCAWMTLPTVYLCYIVIPDCGQNKIDTSINNSNFC